VRHGGICNHRPEEVERALAVGPVAALQYEYSVLARGVEEAVLPLALARKLGVIVWATLASGFLTDGFSLEQLHENDFRRKHAFAQLELEPVRAALRGDRRTAAEGAVAFVLSHAAVTGAIVGVRNEREAREVAQRAELRLTPDEVAAIQSTT
jgi:aryl-alcohol dehydrogenase-like predicted oxidoreductase